MQEIIMNRIVPKVAPFSVETNRKERIGLLGGTFNPPHMGHLIIAEQVGKQLGLDAVWFLPAHVPPHKRVKHLAKVEERKKMIQSAIGDNSFFKLDETDLKREGKSYTYDTIKQLKKEHPEKEFYFIIGGDMAESLSEWYRIDELVQMIQFVAVKRKGYSADTDYSVIWVDCPLIEISSTQIRKKISDGCTIRYLVPESTRKYIEKMGLYKDDE